MTAHPARWKGHEERAQGRHLLCPRWTGPSGMVYLGTTRGQKPKVITFSDLPDYTGYFTETFSCHCHTSTSKRLIKTSAEKYFLWFIGGKNMRGSDQPVQYNEVFWSQRIFSALNHSTHVSLKAFYSGSYLMKHIHGTKTLQMSVKMTVTHPPHLAV